MYGINYRFKRIGRFKTTQDDSSKTARNEKGLQTFHNPIYDDSEVVKHELPDSHYNSSYKLTEDPEKKKKNAQAVYGKYTFQNPMYSASEVNKQEPAVYSHDNPGYEMTSNPDREA